MPDMDQPIHIAIAEDHCLFRQGMTALLKTEKNIHILFEAENGKELLEKLRRQVPHIVLLDIRMPVMGGMEALEKIRSIYPQVRVIVLSMHSSDLNISTFMAAGASAFLPKNCPLEHVIEAIQNVHQQGYYFNEAISKSVVAELTKLKKTDPRGSSSALTEREMDIVRLLCAEKTVPQIGSELYISTRTVEWHKKNIFEKTKSKSLAGLAIFAIRNKIIPNPDDLFH